MHGNTQNPIVIKFLRYTPASRAKELNDRLNAFPVWLNFQPLAIGIDKDRFKLVNNEQFLSGSKKVVQKVLSLPTTGAI